MRQVLREVSSQRTVGLADAVNDLGTHVICGQRVRYSRAMVYNVLKGKSKSRRLIERIVRKRPDLLDLSWVCEDTIRSAKAIGWKPAWKAETI